MNKRQWWRVLLLVFVIGFTGVAFMGMKTYQDAPPIPDFRSPSGAIVISHDDILLGQGVFQKYALMDYGSMFGDGANRGPDFTADALHEVALGMGRYYTGAMKDNGALDDEFAKVAIQARVQAEIKKNQYDASTNTVTLTEGQEYAYRALIGHYEDMFKGGHRLSFKPANYIKSAEEIKSLSNFFFWGAWVCGANRPDSSSSYTHNWPYDELVGNRPNSAVTFWSVAGIFGLILGIGGVLFVRGKMEKEAGFQTPDAGQSPLSVTDVDRFAPTAGQRATFKFFAVAAVLFGFQVLAGVLTVHDFLGFTKFFGLDLSTYLPVTVSRSWHLQWGLLWIVTCWVGASIFILPMLSGEEPKGQLKLINGLFGLLVLMVAGSAAGILLGPLGKLGNSWWLLGNQGWEFVELGRLWQGMLFAALGLWCYIIYRGVQPFLKGKDVWALPNWLFYTVACVLLLFISGFVAGPKTNFAIADFWRWMVIHMWVESFLEVFTTAIVAVFMVLMGLATLQSATRVVFLSTLLFLGSGILGISHNFYWNAKSVETLAIGGVFSTLQVVPLVLLSLEAWRTRHLPQEAMQGKTPMVFGQTAAFRFLLGVNFWNFMGAGVFGLIINLPIVNYYEHGTYLTVNHGHSAFMGVYGNLSLAALVFCARYLVPDAKWNDRLMKVAFWSLNLGLVLMVALDLFPLGIHQFQTVLDHGLWYARSLEYVMGDTFQTLTWLRAIGGYLFTFGGVTPIALFMVSRLRALKASAASPMLGMLIPAAEETGHDALQAAPHSSTK